MLTDLLPTMGSLRRSPSSLTANCSAIPCPGPILLYLLLSQLILLFNFLLSIVCFGLLFFSLEKGTSYHWILVFALNAGQTFMGQHRISVVFAYTKFGVRRRQADVGRGLGWCFPCFSFGKLIFNDQKFKVPFDLEGLDAGWTCFFRVLARMI